MKRIVEFAVCPEGWTNVENQCFFININSRKNYESAIQACDSMIPRAVLFEPRQEKLTKSVIKSLTKDNIDFWIGVQNTATG